MKRIVFLIVTMTFICLIGCQNNNKEFHDEYSTDKNETYVQDEFNTVYIHADWPYYETAKDIVNASENIYKGVVQSISFEIIDMKTGKIDRNKDSDSTNRMLYTVYTISVTETVKGNKTEKVKIRVMGGLLEYNQKEQQELLISSGLTEKYEGIPILDGERAELALKGTYLFCTEQSVEGFEIVINSTQFAHNINSKNANDIINEYKQ